MSKPLCEELHATTMLFTALGTTVSPLSQLVREDL